MKPSGRNRGAGHCCASCLPPTCHIGYVGAVVCGNTTARDFPDRRCVICHICAAFCYIPFSASAVRMNSSYGSFGLDELWAEYQGGTQWPQGNGCCGQASTVCSDFTSLEPTISNLKYPLLDVTGQDTAFNENYAWGARCYIQPPYLFASAAGTVSTLQHTFWCPGGYSAGPPMAPSTSVLEATYELEALTHDAHIKASGPCQLSSPSTGIEMLAELFERPTSQRFDPQITETSADRSIRRQQPRCETDLYTAQWIRGERSGRAGWCGFGCGWFKLKDSAYWVRSSGLSLPLPY